MKRRIEYLRSEGFDVLDVLWQRHLLAMKEGYRYEFAPQSGQAVERAGADTV